MPSLKAKAREAREAQKPPSSIVQERSAKRKSASSVFKSTERVADSDLESETETETELSSDSEEETTNTMPPVAKATSQTPKVADIAKVNGQNGKHAHTSNGNQTDEEQEDSSISDTLSTHESTSDVSSDEQAGKDESSSDSDSGHESDGSESVVEEPEQQIISIAPPEKSRDSSTMTATKTQKFRSIPAIDYSPPAGFEKLSSHQASHQDAKTKVNQVFKASNLAGKQLWYITAPASVPVSVVKELSLSNLQLGKPALSLDGREYGFVQGLADEKGYDKVMIPDDSTTGYRLGGRAIDQTLHLQQIIQSSNIHHHTLLPNSTSQASSKATVLAKKPVRQQPQGLKMRFLPIGFGNGRTGSIGPSSSSSEVTSGIDSDAEELSFVPPPTFRRPLGPDRQLGEVHSPSTGTEKTAPKPPLENSDEDMEDAPEQAEVLQASQSSPRSLKRKLSDTTTKNPPASLSKHSKTSKNILKISKIPQSPVGSRDLLSTKINGTHMPKQPLLEQSLTVGSSVKTSLVPPPRASHINASFSTNISPLKKTTPIPPPSRPHFPASNPLNGYLSGNGITATTGPVEDGRAKTGLEEPLVESQVQRDQTSEPLNDIDKKKEKRRRKKEANLLSQGEPRVSGMANIGETPDESSKIYSPFQNLKQPSSATKQPPTIGPSKFLAEAKMATIQPEAKNGISSSPKTKTPTTKSATPKQNGTEITLPKVTTPILPSPRKESVILPPKFRGSVSG